MSLLYGENEALERVRGQMKQRNTGGIMYPSGTNGRGNPGGREAHARGDSVGGMPSEGGSRMKPMHGGNHAMEGVVGKNKRNAVRQTRNEMGRSSHATGGQPRCYDDGDMVEKSSGGGLGRSLRKTVTGSDHPGQAAKHQNAHTRNMFTFGERAKGNGHYDREEHKFGSGIGSDFKKLGHDVKKGWGKEIGNPFKEKITDPSKKGLAKAGEGIRRTANVAEHEMQRGLGLAKKGSQVAGRAIRSEYRKHGKD